MSDRVKHPIKQDLAWGAHLDLSRLVQGCCGSEQVRPLQHTATLTTKRSCRREQQHRTVTQTNEDMMFPREVSQRPEQAPEKLLLGVRVWCIPRQ